VTNQSSSQNKELGYSFINHRIYSLKQVIWFPRTQAFMLTIDQAIFALWCQTQRMITQ